MRAGHRAIPAEQEPQRPTSQGAETKKANEKSQTTIKVGRAEYGHGGVYLQFSFANAFDRSIGQHVVGAIHTNTIEGFWSIFKRGIVGSFHKVSRKYLPLYVAEFQFRYNNRMNSDIFGAAISNC